MNNTTTLANLNLALQLAAQDWLVFPCRPDKTPATGTGFKDATKDPEKIKAWVWPLIGVWCEGSGFFTLDIDVKNSVDGLATWVKLIENNTTGPVEYGPAQLTPSGGRHYLFKLPKNIKVPNNAGKLGPGLDLRSAGYICTGTGYTWIPGHGPETPLPDAPAWLLDLIGKMHEKPASKAAPAAPVASEQKDPGGFWLDKYLAQAQPGNRNQTGFELACQLRDSGIGALEARHIMVTYAAKVPGEGYTEKEALTSWESAYLAPRRDPATLPGAGNNNGHHQEREIPEPHTPTTPGTTPEKPTKTADDKKYIPDDGDLANQWLAQAPLTAYCMGEWRRYSEGTWPADDGDIVGREILTIVEAARYDGVRVTSTRVASVKELARIKSEVKNNLWDSDPDIIACQNGALHIPTMRLLPHNPDYRATFKVGYDYDPQALADVWRFALSTTIPAAADFLQEFVGYCLTPDTRHELALWLYGPLGSGKSTLIEGIQAMLGERATLLGLADVERSRFGLGDLRGQTLAVASEQPAIFMQATHVLNAIISGEKIRTERKYQDPIEFIPRVKLIWAMNELPRVPDAGNGLFRRVKVIKFPALAESDRDPSVKEAIKNEGAGILNWALEGLARLRARGRFEVPACVKDATSDFQRTNDTPAVFVAECCITGAEYKTKSSLLYARYSAWCLANGHKPKSSTAMADDWERLGFEKKKEPTSNFWYGVGILSDDLL